MEHFFLSWPVGSQFANNPILHLLHIKTIEDRDPSVVVTCICMGDVDIP